MRRQSRSMDTGKHLDWLEQKHEMLSKQVHQLETRGWLSTEEQLDLRDLKKKKLHTKDSLEAFRRERIHSVHS